MKLIEAITRVKPEKVELYETTFRKYRALIYEKEPGTRFFELCKEPTDPYVYHTFEAFVDEAAVAAHIAMDYYLPTAKIFLECLEGDHMEEAAKRGLTEPRDIYSLCRGLKRLRYETL